MEGRTSTVATFNEAEDAQAVASRLRQAGIEAQVADESKLQKYWFLSKPLANEKVEVHEKDFERARQLLEGAESNEHLLSHEIRCPQCGSPQVEYPQFTRKFTLPSFVEIFCFLHIIEKEFYCKHCHNQWPMKVPVPPPLDILNWRKDKLAGPQY
jgi:hypothetical protein